MKTPHLSKLILVLIVIGLFSCNPDEVGDTTNYWNSNTLARVQLKGQVKTVISSGGMQSDEYSSTGYIQSSVYQDVTSGIHSTTTYNYSGNRLVSIEFESTGGKGVQYTTNFEYQSVGKFVVVDKYSLLSDAMVPNLKAQYNNSSRSDYLFQGNILKIIDSYTSESYKDTTEVEYNNEYPTKITTKDNVIYDGFIWDLYGKFNFYQRTLTTETYTNVCKYYFHSDVEYLMLDSMVQTNVQGSFIRKDVDMYLYNSNKDLVFFKNYMGENEYTYEYDSHNNWVSKSTKYRSSSTQAWGNPTVETREITYY